VSIQASSAILYLQELAGLRRFLIMENDAGFFFSPSHLALSASCAVKLEFRF
jgi:hypothetical protein